MQAVSDAQGMSDGKPFLLNLYNPGESHLTWIGVICCDMNIGMYQLSRAGHGNSSTMYSQAHLHWPVQNNPRYTSQFTHET